MPAWIPRTALTVALAVLATAPLLAQTRAHGDDPHDPALRPVAWLAGCWRLQRGDLIIDEQWMRPAGPVMLGMNRTMRGARLADSEFLRLQVTDGVLFYIALPSRQTETHFRLEEASDTLVTFSAPEHDFPQHVSYRAIGRDSLVASIFGVVRGQQRRVDFPKRRVACDPEP